MPDPSNGDKCKLEEGLSQELHQELPAVVREMVASCGTTQCFEHISPVPLPSQEGAARIVAKSRKVLFPGYFDGHKIERVNLEYHMGMELSELYELVADQVTWAVRHDCFRHDLSCTHCGERGQLAALEFLRGLAEIRRLLSLDVLAAQEGDPASGGVDEIIFSYPGLFAVTVYRLAPYAAPPGRAPVAPHDERVRPRQDRHRHPSRGRDRQELFHRPRHGGGHRRDGGDRRPGAPVPGGHPGGHVPVQGAGGEPARGQAPPHPGGRGDRLCRGHHPGRPDRGGGAQRGGGATCGSPSRCPRTPRCFSRSRNWSTWAPGGPERKSHDHPHQPRRHPRGGRHPPGAFERKLPGGHGGPGGGQAGVPEPPGLGEGPHRRGHDRGGRGRGQDRPRHPHRGAHQRQHRHRPGLCLRGEEIPPAADHARVHEH